MISQTAMMPEENLGLVVLTNSRNRRQSGLCETRFSTFFSTSRRNAIGTRKRLERAKQSKAREAEEDKKIVACARAEHETELGFERLRRNLRRARFTATRPSRKKTANSFCGLFRRRISSPIWNTGITTRFQIKWRPTVAYNFPRGFVTFTIDKTGKAGRNENRPAEQRFLVLRTGIQTKIKWESEKVKR